MQGIPFSRNHSTSLQHVTIQGTNTKDIHAPPRKDYPPPRPAPPARRKPRKRKREETAGRGSPAALATHPLRPRVPPCFQVSGLVLLLCPCAPPSFSGTVGLLLEGGEEGGKGCE